MQPKRFWAGALMLVTVLSVASQEKPSTDPAPQPLRPVTEVEGKSLSQWIVDLKNPDASLREHAISVLPLFGASAGSSDIITLLLDRCQDRDASPRIRAVMALNTLEIRQTDVPRVVTALMTRLNTDEQAIIRYYAVLGLLRFGEDSRPAIGALATNSQSIATWEIRRACLACLTLCGRTAKGTPDPRATGAFITGSKDATAEVRLEAAMGLGMTGKTTDEKLALPADQALQHLTKDKDRRVAIWAQVSQMALHGVNDAALASVASSLRANEVVVRVHACRAIGAMGKSAKSLQGKLMDALNDKDINVQYAAIMALAGMEDRAPSVLSALKDISDRKDADQNIRQAALTAHDFLRKGVAKPKP